MYLIKQSCLKMWIFESKPPKKTKSFFFSIFFSFEKIPEESMQKLKFGWNVKNCIFTLKKVIFLWSYPTFLTNFFHNRSCFILLLFISCSNSIFPSIAFFFEPKNGFFSAASKVKLWQFQPIQFIASFVILAKCWAKVLATSNFSIKIVAAGKLFLIF